MKRASQRPNSKHSKATAETTYLLAWEEIYEPRTENARTLEQAENLFSLSEWHDQDLYSHG